MMKSYLPMGYQLQTDEQIKDMDRKFELYEYYGIPYGIFDDSESDINIEKDRTAAKLMIMQGITIPDDLKKRLLEYKNVDKREKKEEQVLTKQGNIEKVQSEPDKESIVRIIQ